MSAHGYFEEPKIGVPTVESREMWNRRPES